MAREKKISLPKPHAKYLKPNFSDLCFLQCWKFPCGPPLTLLKCHETHCQGTLPEAGGHVQIRVQQQPKSNFLYLWGFCLQLNSRDLKSTMQIPDLANLSLRKKEKRVKKEKWSRWKPKTLENNCCWKLCEWLWATANTLEKLMLLFL